MRVAPPPAFSVPAATMRPSRNVASARTPSSEVPGRSGTNCPWSPKSLSSRPDFECSRSTTNLPAAAPPASTRPLESASIAPPTASEFLALSVCVPAVPKWRSGWPARAWATAGATSAAVSRTTRMRVIRWAPTRGGGDRCGMGRYAVFNEPAISAAISATSVGVRRAAAG